VSAPINEEIFHRSIVQTTFLKRIPSELLERYFPGKEKIVHTTQAKILRILISSAVFSYSHSFNKLSETDLQSQMTHTFVLGLFLGIVKEMDFDGCSIPLCMVLHSLYNTFACYILPKFDRCSIVSGT